MQNLRHRSGLFAIIVGMIVFLLAPAVAEAHAGHAHMPQAVNVEMAEPPADLEGTLAPAPIVEEAFAASDTPRPEKGSGCVGGCCGTAHACCALDLASTPNADAPDWRHARIVSLEASALSGIDPTSQRKPPRSFS